ncbi:hypothetical protein HHX48_08465 [Salinimonas sp. HHU 13199]|uniref:Uncharacterized protein n=1 Tax=Salinimonas profundi TaxID=2729140 RepID=A0ABR8LHP4_9ALTE|nr:hypothetical protein [Salinimonas profundi]MBD3585764.1 hypothetical protein [Salinimonas profundi]
MTAIITFTLIFVLLGLAYYLDARYGWQFVAWMNGTTDNPFVSKPRKNAFARSAEKQQHADKDKEIKALRERIETLEAIVTDTTFELNQKLNRL